MSCDNTGVSKSYKRNQIASAVALISFVVAVPLVIFLIKDGQPNNPVDINMESTPCTQGNSISEWLGSEVAFIEHGARLYRKPELGFESSLSWREGGVLSEYKVFTSAEHSLINAKDASESYRKCRDFLDAHHKDQEFSRGAISRYLKIVERRILGSGNLSEVSLNMMARMSDYFIRRYPSHSPNYDFDVWFEIEVKKLKPTSSIKLEQFSRGTELSTLLGSLSAVLAFSNSSLVTDTVFDFVDAISNDPEKYNIFSANYLNANAVIRAFDYSVTYLESVARDSGNELNEDDVKYIVSSIMMEAVKPGRSYSEYLLIKQWVTAWQERYPFDSLFVKDKVSEFASRHMTGRDYVGRGDYENLRNSYRRLYEAEDLLNEITSKEIQDNKIRLRVYDERSIKKLPDDVQGEVLDIIE